MRLPVSLKPFPVGKAAQQGRMRGGFATAIRLRAAEAWFPLIRQRAGPLTASPEGEAIPHFYCSFSGCSGIHSLAGTTVASAQRCSRS